MIEQEPVLKLVAREADFFLTAISSLMLSFAVLGSISSKREYLLPVRIFAD